MIQKFAEQLRLQMQEKRDDLAQYVTTGRCADYAEYKDKTGEIHGIDSAEYMLSDLRDAMERGVDK